MKNISITLMRNYNFCSILFHKMSEKHLVKGLDDCLSGDYATLNILLKGSNNSSILLLFPCLPAGRLPIPIGILYPLNSILAPTRIINIAKDFFTIF